MFILFGKLIKIRKHLSRFIHNAVLFALITEYAHKSAVVNAVADILIAVLRYIPLLHTRKMPVKRGVEIFPVAVTQSSAYPHTDNALYACVKAV